MMKNAIRGLLLHIIGVPLEGEAGIQERKETLEILADIFEQEGDEKRMQWVRRAVSSLTSIRDSSLPFYPDTIRYCVTWRIEMGKGKLPCDDDLIQSILVGICKDIAGVRPGFSTLGSWYVSTLGDDNHRIPCIIGKYIQMNSPTSMVFWTDATGEQTGSVNGLFVDDDGDVVWQMVTLAVDKWMQDRAKQLLLPNYHTVC